MDDASSSNHPQLPAPQMIQSTNDVELALYDLGGDAEDVLMVHATGFCAGVWLPVAERLGGLHLSALDVRGHGRSTVPQTGMDWNGTAQDVLATVDALGLEEPFGVGHSMGGASLVLAEQARPGTFRGLWLFEPIIFPPELNTGSDNPLATGARRRRAAFTSASEAFKNFSSKPPFSALDPAALAAYIEYGFEPHDDGSVSLRCLPEVEAQTYEMGSRHDAFSHLDEIHCPVTVLRGAESYPGPASLAPRIAELLPSGELEEHPELGHFGPLESPSSMAESILAAMKADPRS
ncbi:MAG: alpha/beta hydrolase [Microthrixaceae bacterium]